jgi:AcrR family transcriptional regulator
MRDQQNDSADPAESLAGLAAPERLRLRSALTEAFVSGHYRATDVELLRALADPLDFDSLFSGKEDCFLYLYEEAVAEARDAILASDRPGEPWSRRLAIAIWSLLAAIDAQPTAARLVLVEAEAATPTIFRRFFETIGSVAPFMREGRLAAEHAMPEITDAFLPGGVATLLTRHLRAGGEEPASALFQPILQLLLTYYLADSEVARVAAEQGLARPV